MIHEDIDNLLRAGISIIEKEILGIQTRQLEESLNKADADKLIEYIKTLVIVRKDWRIAKKEESADVSAIDNLDAEIEKEVKKLVEKAKNE